MAESNDNVSRRLDQYLELTIDLRVAQVVTDRQISQLTQEVRELRETVFTAMVPLFLKHQEWMEKHEERMARHEERMERYEERMETHQKSIDAHSKNIEDLYRSQEHLLRRLFGEDLGPSPQA